MISREKSILAPICWNAKILESIDQIWFHATFFSVLVFLFGIYGEFTHITINLFQSLICLRTWKHMKDFSVMKASQFIEIDWWCWWIKSAYNRYTKRIGERERERVSDSRVSERRPRGWGGRRPGIELYEPVNSEGGVIRILNVGPRRYSSILVFFKTLFPLRNRNSNVL